MDGTNRIDEFYHHNMKKEETEKGDKEPPQQYTGTWLPRHVMRMLWRGKLTPIEVMVLATIDSMVGEHGCWASNSYIADLIHIREKSAGRIICRLRKLQLVKQIGFDGRRRYLETRWTRAKDP